MDRQSPLPVEVQVQNFGARQNLDAVPNRIGLAIFSSIRSRGAGFVLVAFGKTTRLATSAPCG
jgi:hypothetical protein